MDAISIDNNYWQRKRRYRHKHIVLGYRMD